MHASNSGRKSQNTMLPDGTVFRSWEVDPVWKRTFHVAQAASNASDDNPGTESSPWRTIGKAAAVLRPGQRVIVHAGVYRECVHPARGGTSPNRMIGYEAAPGEKVVITATDRWRPRWQPTPDHRFLKPGVFPPTTKPRAPRTWRAELTGAMFEGANVFCLQNFLIPPAPEGTQLNLLSGYVLRRGQMFLGGRPLTQVGSYGQLETTENAFWVEYGGTAVHVRLAGDARPAGKTFEITTREQVIAPRERFLGYIRIAGFTIFGSGNGIPVGEPQRGAVGAGNGHHWIIEDCEIAHANTIGIDLGCGIWSYRPAAIQGFHIIRRNHIHHCGVCGVAAWLDRPNQDLLIEDNLVEDIGGLQVGGHYESAGIKIHYAANSLLRRNVFLRSDGCSGLWLDGVITNTRVTQNLFYGSIGTPWGGCCVEISQGPVLIDNNIVLNCRNHGIYEHDSARLLVMQNLVANGGGPAVNLRVGNPKRFDFFDRHPEGHHRVYGNVLVGFNAYIVAPELDLKSDWNVLGGWTRADRWGQFGVGNDGKVATLRAWRRLGHDAHSRTMLLTVTFDERTLELRVRARQGARLPAIPSLPPLMRRLPGEKVLLGKYRRSPLLKVGSSVAKAEALLQVDFFGTPRTDKGLRIGPIENLPLDDTPVRVDPRKQ